MDDMDDMDDYDHCIEFENSTSNSIPSDLEFNMKRIVSNAEIAELLRKEVGLTTQEKNLKSEVLTKKVEDLRLQIAKSDSDLAAFNLKPEHEQNMFDLCILSGRCALYRNELSSLNVEYAGTDFDLTSATFANSIKQLRREGEFYKADRLEKLMERCKKSRISVVVDNS